MARKGMGKGTGKGYKNMIGVDSKIHSMSSKGIKQPQRINPINLYGKNLTQKERLIKEVFEKCDISKASLKYEDLSNLTIDGLKQSLKLIPLRKSHSVSSSPNNPNDPNDEKNYFSSNDLSNIKKRTNNNYHTENLIFIAKKTGFPTVQLKRIKEMSDKRGYLVDVHGRDLIYNDLMKHLQNKLSQEEYNKVYQRL